MVMRHFDKVLFVIRTHLNSLISCRSHSSTAAVINLTNIESLLVYTNDNRTVRIWPADYDGFPLILIIIIIIVSDISIDHFYLVVDFSHASIQTVYQHDNDRRNHLYYRLTDRALLVKHFKIIWHHHCNSSHVAHLLHTCCFLFFCANQPIFILPLHLSVLGHLKKSLAIQNFERLHFEIGVSSCRCQLWLIKFKTAFAVRSNRWARPLHRRRVITRAFRSPHSCRPVPVWPLLSVRRSKNPYHCRSVMHCICHPPINLICWSTSVCKRIRRWIRPARPTVQVNRKLSASPVLWLSAPYWSPVSCWHICLMLLMIWCADVVRCLPIPANVFDNGITRFTQRCDRPATLLIHRMQPNLIRWAALGLQLEWSPG